MSNYVIKVELLEQVLISLTEIIEDPSIEDPINTEVYEFLLAQWKEETKDDFPVENFPKLKPDDVSPEMLSELIQSWAFAIDWTSLAADNIDMYKKMEYVAETINSVLIQMTYASLPETNKTKPAKSRVTKKQASKKKSLKNAHKLVQDFLNGDWITSLLVERPGERKGTDRAVSSTFGEYSITRNEAHVLLIDGKSYDYMNRSAAISQWFAAQIKAYADYLRGIAGGNENQAQEMAYISDLLTGISSPKSNSTERDWSEGKKVTITFTGTNLPGVALRIDPVEFTEVEIQQMAEQIQELNKIAKKAKGAMVTPDSIKFAEDIEVKLVSHTSKFEMPAPPSKYDLSLVNIDRPAEDLVNQIKKVLSKPADERPDLVSALFYGVPGSGKSQLANYIGNRLGRRVIKKTYAELQSMYVGEGEKQLHEAFLEAEIENAILLIDEIDSVAGNRDKADKNYQKTFVNQLLTELDEFKGIFIATSNFMDGLDPAILRRLFLKLEFKFMNEEQVQKCFELYFPKLAKSKVGFMDYLTPGDFRAVQEASLFETKRMTVKRVRELLEQEIALKKKTLGAVIKAEKKVGYEL